MKLHLLAVPKDHPRSMATAFCGRTYEGQGPRQPEDKSPITTACGKTAYFRAALIHPVDVSLCNACFQNVSLLPEDQRTRVLIVVKKHIDDKLEDWEIKLANPDEIEQRISLAAFHLRLFHISDLSSLAGLPRDTVRLYLKKLLEDHVLTYDETSRCYSFTDNQNKMQEFSNKIYQYHEEDGLFERIAEKEL